MDDKLVNTLLSLGLITFLVAIIISGSRGNKKDTLYWGTTCPHCHEVIAWIEKNKIESKVKITKKEVYENKQNAKDMGEKAKSCQMDTSLGVGVPFMYTVEGKCLMGTTEITSYLSAKAGITNNYPIKQATDSAKTASGSAQAASNSAEINR